MAERLPLSAYTVEATRPSLDVAGAFPDDVDKLMVSMLTPSKHVGQVIDRLHFLRQLTQTPTEHLPLLAGTKWTCRLLDILIKDLGRFLSEFEQQQRRESLRQHAAHLKDSGALATLLQATRLELAKVEAERDAAYAALERTNTAHSTCHAGLTGQTAPARMHPLSVSTSGL